MGKNTFIFSKYMSLIALSAIQDFNKTCPCISKGDNL